MGTVSLQCADYKATVVLTMFLMISAGSGNKVRRLGLQLRHVFQTYFASWYVSVACLDTVIQLQISFIL